jgi:hypothetical protein
MEDLFAIIGLFTLPLTIGFGVAWLMTRAKLHRLRGERQAPAPRSERFERFERIEHAVEAIALEVERISEGQRFTTKLLADRQPGMHGSGNVITPH